MIQLPPGFDPNQLYSDLFTVAAPFAGIAFLIAVGALIVKLIRRA